MTPRFLSAIVALFCAGTLSAAPTITPGKIVSSASFVAVNGIAQGSFFSIIGAGLGPATGVSSGLPYQTIFPASNGSSVTIKSGGTSYNAYIAYAGDTQINAVMPSTVPVGPATLTVTFNGQTSSSQNINVVAAEPGVFAENYQGWGQAVAQLFPVPTRNNLANPANAGGTMTIYLTGLGKTPNGLPDNDAIPAAQLVNVASSENVIVEIDGQDITPSYAGRQGQFPALDQINFTLPADVPLGCFVRGQVIANGVRSNAFSIATASPGASCPNAFGLTASALQTLQSGGSVKLGIITIESVYDLTPSQSAPQLESVASASFFSANKAAVVALDGVLSAAALPSGAVWDPSLVPPLGTCATFDANAYTLFPPDTFSQLRDAFGAGITTAAFNQAIPGSNLAPVSIGPQITIFGGPDGRTITLTPNTSAATAGLFDQYSASVPQSAFVFAGTWNLPASGNNGQVGGSFYLPRELAWSNFPPSGVIPRNQDLVIQYIGGGGSDNMVTLGGGSLDTNGAGSIFLCQPIIGAGPFTVPSSVLQTLPAVAPANAVISSMAVTETGVTAMQTVGLDGAVVVYSTGERMDATYQ